MALHLLQEDVDVERRLAVVEAHDEAEGEEVRLQRVEEAAAEGVARQRPAQGVDDRVQRALRLPELLHPQRVDHRIVGPDLLPAQPGLGQGAARALRQHRDLGLDVGGRGVSGAGLAVALEAAGRGAHAAHASLLHEKALGREAREHVHTQALGLCSEPPHDLAERGHVVAVVAHGGRGGQAQRAALRQQIDPLRAHGRAQREIRVLQLREQLAQRRGIDHCSRQRMSAERFRLLEHRDLDGADAAARFLILLHQAGQLDGAGQARGSAAHEHDVHLDRLRVRRIRADQPVHGEVRLVARGHDEAVRGCWAHGGS
jgi:hypothetical protein